MYTLHIGADAIARAAAAVAVAVAVAADIDVVETAFGPVPFVPSRRVVGIVVGRGRGRSEERNSERRRGVVVGVSFESEEV